MGEKRKAKARTELLNEANLRGKNFVKQIGWKCDWSQRIHCKKTNIPESENKPKHVFLFSLLCQTTRTFLFSDAQYTWMFSHALHMLLAAFWALTLSFLVVKDMCHSVVVCVTWFFCSALIFPYLMSVGNISGRSELETFHMAFSGLE